MEARPGPGTRELAVLGEFKPFGLIAEATDGNPPPEKYDYFLFGADAVRESDADEEPWGDHCDHELFVRGNKLIWSTGARVFKRFTLSSQVTMACWCRFCGISEALLCILQVDSLTMYNVSGEVASIPLPWKITSIWPLPFGLLLQQAAEGNSSPQAPFSSSSPLFSGRHNPRNRRETNSPRLNFNFLGSSDLAVQGSSASLSSHLILQDFSEDPQSMYIEERSRLSIMRDFDERTIWTSDRIPLMASFNKGKMQHSVWFSEVASVNEETNSAGGDTVPASLLAKRFSFLRIWQWKGSQTAASKIFLATDDDEVPVICFLLPEQKKLLAVRLQSLVINNESVFDIKPEMSWSIPATAAAPVTVTRPRAILGLLPHSDIISVAPDNSLLLYSGKQCLCKYLLPSWFIERHFSHHYEFTGTASVSCNAKIVGLIDAVEGRINVIVNGGKIFRCELQNRPSSSLLRDCILTMANGLTSQLYNHFLALFWQVGASDFLKRVESSVSEWESFSGIMLQMCRSPNSISRKQSDSFQDSSWKFLINSSFHLNYRGLNILSEIPHVPLNENKACDNCDPDLECSYSSEKAFHFELLMESLDSLHALYESLKLDNLRKKDLKILAYLLCDIANFLGEASYVDHYIRDFPCLYKKAGVQQASSSQRNPPSLFRWLENCLRYGCCSASVHDLPTLVLKEESSVNWARKLVSFYSLICGAKLVGKRLSSGVYCNIAAGSHRSSEELAILAMVGEKFGLQQLDRLPYGVSLPLRHALDKCRESPPTDWPTPAYILIGRQDLALTSLAHSSCQSDGVGNPSNKDFISMSTPYMLHLHPVTIPPVVSDSLGVESGKFEEPDSTDGSLVDGMEHIFNSCSQLRYGRDLRLNEVRRLLCSSRPVAIHASVNPSASDHDAQQAQLWQMAQRTTALPLGRGAFTLATISTLLTEVFTVPKLVLAGRLPAQHNATVNLDPNIRNVQELKTWSEFHNAVAAGLKLTPLQGKVSRTWITYNKPEEPNAIHAGLLLALGLHGHLRVLVITDIFTYFTQEHECTSAGLMLGLAASYRGTMDPAISKSLYVHISSRHSSSYPDLELPTLMQSAALVSVGLLYEGSAHPPTMQTLLNELGRRSTGDNVLEREGHAVSAGFALGLVTLGHGVEARGFMDSLVDRLLRFIGGQESCHEMPASLVPFMDEYNRGAPQIMDGSAVNVDVTAPGAIIALSLMFLKTESEEIYTRISVPQTRFELQYVRPDFILLRVIARNLIMWARVHPSSDWIDAQIPEIIKSRVRGLGNDDNDIDEMDAQTYVQAYVNVVAGACISLGLRFAGTKDANVQELLYDYAVYFLNEIKPISAITRGAFPKGLSRYIDRGTLEICLHLTVLSLTVVMAGSGDLKTFRLLRFLRNRNSADGHANFGVQMAVSLAIGFLFLGGGMRTFSTSNSSIAALLISLYPRLPTGPNDNRCHLQAFRHLYVLASEARWIQTIDIDSGEPVYAPIDVTVKETEHYAETRFSDVTPCILPERSILKMVRVCGPRYWPQVIELVPEDKQWWGSGDKKNPFNSGVLFVKRKVGACSYLDDPIGCQSLLSRAMQKVTSIKSGDGSTSCISGPCPVSLDQLVSTFSSDPSLISFAQLCCKPSWNSRSDVDFQEFCLQVLFECISKDRPALVQVYLSLYATMESMAQQLAEGSGFRDPVAIFNLKVALAYNEAIISGRLTTSRGGIVQSIFLGSLRKRVEELLSCSDGLNYDLCSYIKSGKWPQDESCQGRIMLLSWYLQWFGVPAPYVIFQAMEKLKTKLASPISVPLLRLVLPCTNIAAIREICKFFSSHVAE